MVTVSISRSPLYNSQVTESQMGLQCAFQPALSGHLSITASYLDPKGDHYRQVSLYVCVCVCVTVCVYIVDIIILYLALSFAASAPRELLPKPSAVLEASLPDRG